MTWPTSQDFNEAIQSSSTNFSDPDLRGGKVVTNAIGLPVPCSGNFADVYQVLGRDGARWAVKCFTRQTPRLRERYAEISRHLRQAKLPFTVDFSYLEQGIRVGGRWYPVVKMQWVEGPTLNQFVRKYLDKPAMLEALLQIWARLGPFLRAAEVAHGDLQHGNVLLVPGATPNSLALKLIDYDGLFVPALAGTRSGEIGHASYQHPQRLLEGTYNLEVDRFPLLLVATALRALTVKGQALWDKYDNGDNLLFKEADLSQPQSSALFAELKGLGDPLTGALTARLLAALGGGLTSAPLLEEVMREVRPAASPSRTPRPTPPGERASVAPVAVPMATPVQGGSLPFVASIQKVGSPGTRKRRNPPKRRHTAIAAGLAAGVVLSAAAAWVLRGDWEAAAPAPHPQLVQGRYATSAPTTTEVNEKLPNESNRSEDPKKNTAPQKATPRGDKEDGKEPVQSEPEPASTAGATAPNKTPGPSGDQVPKVEGREPSQTKTEAVSAGAVRPVSESGEPDPIREKLAKAKADYADTIAKLQQQILERLDKAEESARAAGNKKLVDQVKMEREGLTKVGQLPHSVPTRDYHRQRDKARATLDSDYADAIAAYTKAKMGDKADTVEKEREKLQKTDPLDALQPATVWKGTAAQVWTGKTQKSVSDFVLTVLERDGKSFKATVENGNQVREVHGTIDQGVIFWLAKDVKAIKGQEGFNHVGQIVGNEIELEFDGRTKAGGKPTGGTVKLQLEKK